MSKKKKDPLLDRKDLKAKMDALLSEMRENAADKERFDKDVDSLLSLKGQLDTEPMRIFVPEKDVKKEAKDKSYYVAVTDKCALYHNYGGYTIVADRRYDSVLYTVLDDMADAINSDEENEDVTADLLVKAFVLTAPMWCFSDIDATCNIASAVIESQRALQERQMAEPLKEEDFKANSEFEDAVRGMEELKELIDEDKEVEDGQ